MQIKHVSGLKILTYQDSRYRASSKKRKASGGTERGSEKKRYSAKQKDLLQAAYPHGLQSVQQRKVMAASISELDGARVVTPADVTKWMQNIAHQQKKKQ